MDSLGGEKEAVLAAFDAVVALNQEAGVRHDSLNALLKSVAEEKSKAVFDKFCRDIMSCIHGCFAHFTAVLPQLAKVRAHRDFHQVRLKKIPKLWMSLTSSLGLQNMEPINLQSVSRELFDRCMKDFFGTLKESASASGRSEVRLLGDEENSLRYASGFIGMKLLKEFDKNISIKAAQFKECLSKMSKSGNDSSFYAYTREWIDTINRGGLFVVNAETFELFKAIEVKIKEVLPQHLVHSGGKKEAVIQSVVEDRMVQSQWRLVGASIVNEEHSHELLYKIVVMWVTMRGFSLTSKWMEDYKIAKDNIVRKSKSLRKELMTSSSK